MSHARIEFAPGDVIVHSFGDALWESTWLRGLDGKWRTDDPASPIYSDEIARGWVSGGGNKLIHTAAVRPKLAVELPSEPTFGVLEWKAGPNTKTRGQVQRVFAEWYQSPCISGYAQSETSTQVHATGLGLQVPISAVSKFTPASVVPVAAIDSLRDAHSASDWGTTIPRGAVSKFLNAVNKANRS